MSLSGFLDRSHCVAAPGYDRWRVPPAALAIHLSIGQAYAFSVFNLPLSQVIGITSSAADDWTPASIGWIFSLAIISLGVSAFTLGRWVEDAGPRKAMFASATCFGGGFLVAALGVWLHQIWVVYLGYGVIGGVGLGLGYISPITTLLRWFPDRPGLATGIAIGGFGAGAMIGSPLALMLMDQFGSATSVGVSEAFLVMGVLYFAFMQFGVFTVRVPGADWSPASYTASRPATAGAMPTAPRVGTPAGRSDAERRRVARDVHVNEAIQTPQFWLIWAVLLLNVTAGIGVLTQASPMIQEMTQGAVTARSAAGFAALLVLAELMGRLIWSSSSDVVGRRATFAICFALGAALYGFVPRTGHAGNVPLFIAACCVIASISGGGFAMIPAYVREQFGVMHAGAIHGRLLTAWSLAAIAGPLLVNSIREYQVARGAASADAWSLTMYLMAGLMLMGLVANWLVRPVHPKHHFVPDGDVVRG